MFHGTLQSERTLWVAAPVGSAEALAWRAAIGVRVTDVSVQRAYERRGSLLAGVVGKTNL